MTSVARAAAEKPPGSALLSAGVFTDCQYADAGTPAGSKRFYRESPKKLAAAIEHFNAMGDLDFLMHLGDAVDRDEKSYGVVMPIFAQARVPLYHVAGNHDYSISGVLKPKVPEMLGMQAPYYSVERSGWRFIMLDGNHLSLFANTEGTAEWAAASRWMKESKRKLTDYSGGLGAGQIAWLEDQLHQAGAAGQRVVLVCHYPLLPLDGHSLWDAEEVLAVLQKHRSIIAAWWNGHNHDGNYCARHGIHFLNFRGMVDTLQNSYARVDIFADRMEVTGYGREPRRVLRFPAADRPAESLRRPSL